MNFKELSDQHDALGAESEKLFSEKQAIEIDMASIVSQLEFYEKAGTMPGSADEAWPSKARKALKHKSQQLKLIEQRQSRINALLKGVRVKMTHARASTFERMFFNQAKVSLPEETFQKLVEDSAVRAELAGY